MRVRIPEHWRRVIWRIASIASIISTLTAMGVAVRSYTQESPQKNDSAVVETAGARDPLVRIDSQRVAVIVVSSRCKACRSKVFRDAERKLMNAVRSDPAAVLHGVALDANAQAGVKFLQRSGKFDELSAGGRWHNVAAQKYIWGELGGGAPAVPQVILLRRVVRYAPDGVSILEEVVDRRLIGVPEIAEFVATGMQAKRNSNRTTL